MNALTQSADFESLVHNLIVMATTTVDVFGNSVTVEQVDSTNNLQMFMGYYNYAALFFILLGIAVALPGLVLAAPIWYLFKGVEELGGYANTYAGKYAKTYGMFAVMWLAANLRDLIQ